MCDIFSQPGGCRKYMRWSMKTKLQVWIKFITKLFPAQQKKQKVALLHKLPEKPDSYRVYLLYRYTQKMIERIILVHPIHGVCA